jgi:hypothetical protein
MHKKSTTWWQRVIPVGDTSRSPTRRSPGNITSRGWKYSSMSERGPCELCGTRYKMPKPHRCQIFRKGCSSNWNWHVGSETSQATGNGPRPLMQTTMRFANLNNQGGRWYRKSQKDGRKRSRWPARPYLPFLYHQQCYARTQPTQRASSDRSLLLCLRKELLADKCSCLGRAHTEKSAGLLTHHRAIPRRQSFRE